MITPNSQKNPDDERWSLDSYRIAAGFGTIAVLLGYIQIKLQTTLFHSAPAIAHGSLVAGALTIISLVLLPTFPDKSNDIAIWISSEMVRGTHTLMVSLDGDVWAWHQLGVRFDIHDIINSVSGIISLFSAIVALLSSLVSWFCCRGMMEKCRSRWKEKRKNWQILKQKVEVLNQNRIELEALRRAPQSYASEVERRIESTSNNIDTAVNEINSLDIEEILERNGYCGMPNCSWARLGIGRFIATKIKKVDLLTAECEALITSVVQANVRGVRQQVKELVGRQANDAVKDICHYLVNAPDIYITGVSGMGGIGKTEVVKTVNNIMLEGREHFDHVIWVDVPKEFNSLNLQKQLAKQTRLILSADHDVNVNADELCKSLLRRGRFLLILDNLWTPFSLEDIGIPQPTRDNRCKLIIVSRHFKVCAKMNAHPIVTLNLLPSDSALELFVQQVRTLPVNQMSTHEALVAEECGGLPLAIIDFARSLQYNNLTVWDTTIEELQTFIRWEETTTIGCLRLSYERLPNDTIGACFLYCALYPRNHAISTKELMEYWLCEDLLGKEVESFDDAMARTKAILKQIIDAHLLLGQVNEVGEELVRMHPVVRGMAIHIATISEPVSFVKAGLKLVKTPLYWPEKARQVSLMRNNLDELFCTVKCLEVSSLLLQHNPLQGSAIDDNFFSGTPNLKILDLSYTGISILPKSLSNLIELRALLLRGCQNLTTVPSLSRLSKLIVLALSGTQITQLPEGMENLINLKRLDFSCVHKLSIPPGLMAKLKDIEELLLDGCGLLSDLATTPQKMGYEALSRLQCLQVLEINFSSAKVYQNYFSSSKHITRLKSFKFCVGGWYKGSMGKNSLAVMNGFHITGSDPIPLPNNTQELHVMHCHDLTMLPSAGLENLRILVVSNCENLSSLFDTWMPLQLLHRIDEMTVTECPNLKRIQYSQNVMTSTSSTIESTITITNLKKLVLIDLPSLLQCFTDQVSCDSLRAITIWNCPQVRTFPVWSSNRYTATRNYPSHLIEIKAPRSWVDSLKLYSNEKEQLHRMLKVIESHPLDDQTSHRLDIIDQSAARTSRKQAFADLSNGTAIIVADSSKRGCPQPITIGEASSLKKNRKRKQRAKSKKSDAKDKRKKNMQALDWVEEEDYDYEEEM